MDPNASPPTGRVTLVLTDIAGAAALWERDPEAMRAALVVHDALLRETVAVSGGYEGLSTVSSQKVACRVPCREASMIASAGRRRSKTVVPISACPSCRSPCADPHR